MAQTGTYTARKQRSHSPAYNGDGTEEGYVALMDVTITGPTSYPTGGFTLSSIATDMSQITGGVTMARIGTTERIATVVRATGLSAADTKILVMSGGAEVPALTNLSSGGAIYMRLEGNGPLGS